MPPLEPVDGDGEFPIYSLIDSPRVANSIVAFRMASFVYYVFFLPLAQQFRAASLFRSWVRGSNPWGHKVYPRFVAHLGPYLVAYLMSFQHNPYLSGIPFISALFLSLLVSSCHFRAGDRSHWPPGNPCAEKS